MLGKHGLEKTEFSIEPNPQCVYAHHKAQERNRAMSIGKYHSRMSIIADMRLNPNRFENINKSPHVLSTSKNKPTTYFQKQSPRKLTETILPVRPFQAEHDGHLV